MSTPRFLADVNLRREIISGVKRLALAVEFVREQDLGLDEVDDASLLEYAAAHGLIMVTHDVNTMSSNAYDRLADGKPMPGLFLITQDRPTAVAVEALYEIWAASEAEEWEGRVDFLPL